MRVLHVIPSLAPSYGGPASAMPVLARGLAAAGVSVDVATVHDGSEDDSKLQGVFQQDQGYRRISFPRRFAPYRISTALSRWLAAYVAEYDIVHVHAVFTHSSSAACRAAKNASVPFIVRPLGILNSWGMENRRPLLKKLFFKFLEKPAIDAAAGMHYTSRIEADDAARLHIRAPARVLPLGIDLSPYDQPASPAAFFSRFPAADVAGPRVLFLSRIDRKKGIELLLHAFANFKIRFSSAHLIIAGDGPTELVASLRELATGLKVADAVTWTGFLTGDDRRAAFAAADVFCLPSYSENFGMALLEAMAAGLPCVSSDQVALGVEAAVENAVSLTSCDADQIARALEQIASQPEQARLLGRKAWDYARSHHGMKEVGARLAAWYSEICPAADRP